MTDNFLIQMAENEFIFSQDINYSASFHFLLRLPVILVSSETVYDLLLPSETGVRAKQLPTEIVCTILLSAESLDRKQNLAVTYGRIRKPFFADGSVGWKKEIADSFGRSQI